jgi:hypothetical protein
MHAETRRRWSRYVATIVAIAAGIAAAVGAAPTPQATLTPDDAADNDRFGRASAIDGDTVVAGAFAKNTHEGAAYVFTRSGTTWSQQQALTSVDLISNDEFGSSVAVQGDTAVVGALAQNNSSGSVYVFTRTGTTWTQQQKLTAADAENGDVFGFSVSISGDTIAVGAAHKGAGGLQRGAAYVFTRTGTTWAAQQRLTADDAADGDRFGTSISLSGDTVVVGAFGTAAGGAAYVFTRSGTTWSQQQKLTPSDANPGASFGWSVAVDVDTAVVGAFDAGAAYVFTRSGTTWTQQQKLPEADGGPGSNMGTSVAVAGDTAVVGAINGGGVGAAYVYHRTGATWTEQPKLVLDVGGALNEFGQSVGISGDSVVVGADGQDNGQGRAYVFVVSPVAAAPTGYCVPVKTKESVNARQRPKSTFTASGILDTGPDAPDFGGAATFDVGGFHLDVPAFVAKGKSLTYAANGITLSITPSKSGSSHATFSVKAVGDPTGKIDASGPLAFEFKDPANDLSGAANLTTGALGPHAVTSPVLWVVSAAATIKGGGKDSLKLTLGFATDGSVPAAADDLTIAFGGTYSATIPASAFVKKGNTWTHAGKAPGVTKATIDYAKGTIVVAASNVDLGAFAAGGNAVSITVTRGADARSVAVRMALAKTKLSY